MVDSTETVRGMLHLIDRPFAWLDKKLNQQRSRTLGGLVLLALLLTPIWFGHATKPDVPEWLFWAMATVCAPVLFVAIKSLLILQVRAARSDPDASRED